MDENTLLLLDSLLDIAGELISKQIATDQLLLAFYVKINELQTDDITDHDICVLHSLLFRQAFAIVNKRLREKK